MIDGVKILCNLAPEIWEKSKLSFRSELDESTGEILDGRRLAIYNALRFSLVRGKVHNKTYCNINGSLAKYFNKGKDNAFDYNYQAFTQTLQDLENNFGILPEQAILKGFECGINILLPFPTKTVLKHLKTFKNNEFAGLWIGGINVGYKADHQQYTLKIYDKGTQIKSKDKYILRIEIQIKKMEFVKVFGIQTLADLKKPETWSNLSTLLLSYWSECLYINDKDFNFKAMSDRMQKKFLRYINPEYWAGLGKVQRLRAKQELKKICNIFQKRDEKNIITILISEKLEKLKPKNVYQLTNCHPSKETKNYKHFENKNVYQLTTRISGLKGIHNLYNFKSKNINKETNKKKPKIILKTSTKKCLVCHDSLKFKSSNAKYCSKQCNNKYHTQKRKRMRDKTKKAEIKNLNRILKIISKNRLWLEITYTNENKNYTDTLHQREIITTSEWIRKVKTVTITGIRKNLPPVVLTSLRAKKLIRIITQINKHHEAN